MIEEYEQFMFSEICEAMVFKLIEIHLCCIHEFDLIRM
jgi:hypothetical protein